MCPQEQIVIFRRKYMNLIFIRTFSEKSVAELFVELIVIFQKNS